MNASFLRADSSRLSPFLVYCLSFITLGITVAILGPSLPSLADYTRVSLAVISILFVARAVGELGGAFFGGWLYDRLPGHRVMAAAVALMALMLALTPVFAWLGLLIGVIVLLGFSGALLNVGGNTMLVWRYSHRSAPYLNGLHFSFALGAFIAPLVLAQALIWTGGIRWGFWLLALSMVPLAVYLAALPGSPALAGQRRSGDERPADMPFVLLVCLFFCIYLGAELSFGGWIYSYALAMGLASPTSAAYVTSAFFGAITLGRLAAILLAAHFRPRAILLANLSLGLAAASLLLLRPASSPALWLGVIASGWAAAPILPTVLALAERRTPLSGKVTGWFFMAGGVGSLIFPWLTGQLFTLIHPLTMPGLIVTNLAASLLLLLLMARREPQVVESLESKYAA